MVRLIEPLESPKQLTFKIVENKEGSTGDCGCETATEIGLPLKTQPLVSEMTHE